MSKFLVKWQAFGVAIVDADSVDEAAEMASDGAFDFDAIHWDDIQVDGVDIGETEEIPTPKPALDPDVFWTKPEPERDYSGERGQ